jgi:molybdate transport system regulatory protein
MNADHLKIRISHGRHTAMGPGKADLLEFINEFGSISAAAKRMGMSYRRAWELVDTMNRCFDQPLVKTSPGGSHGGGAQVTVFGFHVLNCYRALSTKAKDAADYEINEIMTHLRAPD